MKYHALIVVLISLLSCSLPGCDTATEPGPSITGSSGLYVINEGSYLAGNAELSFIDPVAGTVSGAVFSTTNPGRTLGDIAQSGVIAFGRLYVVVNNSRKVEVIEPGTHQWLQTIPLTTMPREICVVSPSKAYLTNMDSTVSILNLTAGTELRRLTVGPYPEGIVQVAGRLFVLNGGFGYGSTISVIDIAQDSVVNTIRTPFGPAYGVVSEAGLVHISCTGYEAYDDPLNKAPGALLTVDGVSGAVVDTVWFPGTAGKIALDGDGSIYVLGPGVGSSPSVWKFSGGAHPAMSTSSLVTGSFYGIGVHTGRSELYLSIAGDFVSNGRVEVRTLSGSLVRDYTAGIGVAPNGFIFLP